jgi:hypothetical protein
MVKSIELGISGLSVAPGTHMCGLFQGPAEREALELAFLRQGLTVGDKCICVIEGTEQDELLGALAENVDVPAVLGAGQLSVASPSEAFFGRGPFSSPDMIALWGELIGTALGPAGFSFVRSVGEVTVAVREVIGLENLLTYESELNRFIPQYPQVLLCLYDLEHVSGGLLVDLVRTHSTVLMGNTVLDNQYFQPPDQFLGGQAVGDVDG